MAKPNTIIFSDTLYSALCLQLNPDGGGVPAGARAKAGGVNLDWIEERLEVGPLRVPDQGVSISEQQGVWKVRAGALADVAPIAFAHGSDMATYKTIVFDLDFELGERAVHRIVELNLGKTADGRYMSPVNWQMLAAQDHMILLVLSRTSSLTGSRAQKSLNKNLGHPPTTNYDLIHGLPFKFLPFTTPEFGRLLAPDNYLPDDDLDKGLSQALEPWIRQGTAFRFPDEESTPTAIRQASYYAIRSDDHPLTIAGAFRYEKSLLAFLPSTNLKTIPWLKTISGIGEALNMWRSSPEKISKMADASALEKIALIVRPVENPRRGNPVEIFIEIKGKQFPAKIPARGERGASNFNQDHLQLIGFSKKNGLVSIDDAITQIDLGWSTKKFSQTMNALRAGVAIALRDAGLPEGLAGKMFPEGWVGVSNRIKRGNIRISGPTSS